MGFFQSPIKLINILLKQKDINNCVRKSSGWFFSEEAKNEYRCYTTVSQKAEFFFEYLFSIAKTKDNLNALYNIAFVMADSMVDSNLEFGGLSNVMNPDLNPLVAYVKESIIVKGTKDCDYGNVYASELLCALHKEKKPNNYILPGRNGYLRLAKQNPDGSFPDMYKIERDIIWSFCNDRENNLCIGPFAYDICQTEEDDSQDEIKGFFAKEN